MINYRVTDEVCAEKLVEYDSGMLVTSIRGSEKDDSSSLISCKTSMQVYGRLRENCEASHHVHVHLKLQRATGGNSPQNGTSLRNRQNGNHTSWNNSRNHTNWHSQNQNRTRSVNGKRTNVRNISSVVTSITITAQVTNDT
jgi:hypothetical protein